MDLQALGERASTAARGAPSKLKAVLLFTGHVSAAVLEKEKFYSRLDRHDQDTLTRLVLKERADLIRKREDGRETHLQGRFTIPEVAQAVSDHAAVYNFRYQTRELHDFLASRKIQLKEYVGFAARNQEISSKLARQISEQESSRLRKTG